MFIEFVTNKHQSDAPISHLVGVPDVFGESHGVLGDLVAKARVERWRRRNFYYLLVAALQKYCTIFINNIFY